MSGNALDRVVAQLVAVAATLSTLLFFWTPGSGVDRFLNSDLLYLPALFDDLGEGGRILDWRLTPSPYFFPDMVLFSAGWLVSKSQQVLPWLLAPMQALLWSPAIMLLADREANGSPARVSWVPSALALHVGLSLYRQGSAAAMAPFLVLTYHAGQALLGGLVLGVLHKASRRRFFLGAFLVLLGSISDPFFVIGFLLSLVVDVLFSAGDLRPRLGRCCVLLLAAGLGLGLRKFLPLPVQQSGLLSWPRTLEALAIFKQTASDSGGQVAFVFWFIGLLVVLAVWRLGHRPRVLILWGMVGLASVLGAVAIGAPTSFPHSRYLTAHTIALAAVLSISMARLLPLPRLWLLLGVLATGHSVSVLFNARANLRHLGGGAQNKFVACFQALRLESKLPLSRCAAGYWAAKPVDLYSTPRAVALQVKPDGTPDWFISTKRRFGDGLPIDCAVFPTSDVGVFLGRHGPASVRKDCDSVTVLGYSGEDAARLNRSLLPLLAQPPIPSFFF